jgi:O-antigen ligase
MNEKNLKTAPRNRFNSVTFIIFWAFSIIFAIGATLSISLEEIGAGGAIVIFLLRLILGYEKIKGSKLTIPVLMLCGGMVLSSLLVSTDRLHSLKDNLHSFWMVFFFYVVISSVNDKKYRTLMNILLSVGIISACYGILQGFTGIDVWHRHRLPSNGFLFDAVGGSGLHLTYGGLMSMQCVVFLSLFMESKETKTRLFYSAGTALSFFAVIMSFSRSSWVGLAAGLVFLLIMNIRKTWKWAAGAVVVSMIIIALVPFVRTRALTIVSAKKVADSSRFEIWGTAWNILKKNPVFGVGSGNFIKLYDQNRPAGSHFDAKGEPHNDILNCWLNGGVLGLLGYLCLFIVLILSGVRAWLKAPDENFLSLGLAASAIVMLFQGLSQCYMTDAENGWLFWFFAAGLTVLAQIKETSEKNGINR